MIFNKLFPNRIGVIAILSACILMAAGCSLFRNIANVQKPDLKVSNVRVTDFNFNELELTYDITVENPNELSVQMSSYDYGLKLNNEPFLEGRQDKGIKINASDVSTFEVPVKLNFIDVYKGIQTLTNNYEAEYEFLSTLTFDLPVLGLTEIPVNKKGTIPLLHTPKIIIKGIKVQNLSLSQASLVLNMQFDNPNAFGITVNNFNYDLNINGTRWAEGSALNNTKIPEKGTSQLQIPITLNINEMGISAYRLLTGSQELTYQLNGNFDLGTTNPLLDQTNFIINQNGNVALSGRN